MFFFYIDESGTGLRDKRTNFFVLGCLAIDSKDWPNVDNEVNAIKRHIITWAKPEDWEIKGRDLRRGEQFFKSLNWDARFNAFHDIGRLLAKLPARLFAVQVDKRFLTEYVNSEDLYRLAFCRMLDEIEQFLAVHDGIGMVMVDMRSDLHSSVQDRRLLDAYREWRSTRSGESHIVEIPWFGFSSFYAGLQLADFFSYLVDYVSNDLPRDARDEGLVNVYGLFESKVRFISIP